MAWYIIKTRYMADTVRNGGAAGLHCKIMTYFHYVIFSLQNVYEV